MLASLWRLGSTSLDDRPSWRCCPRTAAACADACQHAVMAVNVQGRDQRRQALDQRERHEAQLRAGTPRFSSMEGKHLDSETEKPCNRQWQDDQVRARRVRAGPPMAGRARSRLEATQRRGSGPYSASRFPDSASLPRDASPVRRQSKAWCPPRLRARSSGSA